MIKKYKDKRDRRKAKNRYIIKGSLQRPRVSVFRSNCHLYCQLIDDGSGKTLISLGTKSLKLSKETKDKDKAKEVGIQLGKSALDKNIKSVVFDRSGYKYHGQVKSLAEGLRQSGLKF